METDIAFMPGGGLGDMICSLPVLDYLMKVFPSSLFDICHTIKKENYSAVLGENRLRRIRTVYDQSDPNLKYGATFRVDEFCKMTFMIQFLEASPQFSMNYIKNQTRMAALNNTDKIFPFAMNQIANHAVKLGLNRITFPQYTVGVENYIQPIIPNDGFENQGYITINDGWNISGKGFRTTKAWSEDSWRSFISVARSMGKQVVQLGSSEMGTDYDVDVQLRGKLTFLESLKWLKGSSCHIDIEGGLVHAATAMGVKCIVLHGPTNFDFYAYPQNINLQHGSCQNCWHMTPDWGANCMTGNHTCMKHDPKIVLQELEKVLYSNA